MKDIKKIAFIIQARLNSSRLPFKMIKNFKDGENLLDKAIRKFVDSELIPNENIFISVGEEKLIEIARKYPVKVFERSAKSYLNESKLQDIFEWHEDLSKEYDYYFMINGCSPFIKIETINEFLKQFLSTSSEGLFAVLERKTIAWDSNLKMINSKNNLKTLNTKEANKIYLPAHVLYAGKIIKIKKGIHMGTFNDTNDPELFIITDELECWDIDYEWQFNVANSLLGENLK